MLTWWSNVTPLAYTVKWIGALTHAAARSARTRARRCSWVPRAHRPSPAPRSDMAHRPPLQLLPARDAALDDAWLVGSQPAPALDAEFLCCSTSCKLCTCTAYMLKWISSSPDASFPPWSSSQRPFSVSLHLIEHLAGSVARRGCAAGVVRHWVFKVLDNVHGHPMLLNLPDNGHRRAGRILRPSCRRRRALSPPRGGYHRAASASEPPCRPETSAHALAIVLLRAAARV